MSIEYGQDPRLRRNSTLFWKILKALLKRMAKMMLGNLIRRALLRAAGYPIGENAYIGEDLIIIDEPAEIGYVRIGNRVAIAPRVTFIVSSRPNDSLIGPYVPTAHGPIIIEDDVWLGTAVVIMPNVRIGRGSVVGAQSLVTRDVPPFTIVMGTPAKPHGTINFPGE